MIIAFVQALLITLFCLAFYRVRHKTTSGFFAYIGIYGSSLRSVWYAIALAVLAAVCYLGLFAYLGLQHLVLNPHNPAWALRTNGFTLAEIVKVLGFAFIGTALWEELLFRGFLAKRLINYLGFYAGNITQSVLFGLMHIAVYLLVRLTLSLPAYILIFLMPTLLAYTMTYLNERVAKGSILPSYVVHAVLNILTPITAAIFF